MPLKDSTYSWPAVSQSTVKYQGVQNPAENWTQSRTISRTATRDGTRLPGWHKIIESGNNATTNLTAVYDTIYYTFGSVSIHTEWIPDPLNNYRDYKLWGALSVVNGQNHRNVKAPVKSTTFADNQARAKFYKKLRNMQVQFSGPTFLGELRETLHMLRRPAQALWSKNLGYLDAVGRAKRLDPKAWTKRLSGLWLEYSFGWIPLLHDCEDAVKAWSRLCERQKTRVISAGYEQYFDRTNELDALYDQGTRPYGGNVIQQIKSTSQLTETVSVRYKGSINAQAETTSKWDNWALFGFTPSEFLPTAWELLPWSFLWDYFTNIGDILTASVTDTSRIRFVNKTVRQFTEFRGKLEFNLAQAQAVMGGSFRTSGSGDPGEFVLKRKVVSRSANSGISLPRFQLSSDLSDGQLGNIAALLGQARSLHSQSYRKRF